jgi:RHS repeat-associated protein
MEFYKSKYTAKGSSLSSLNYLFGYQGSEKDNELNSSNGSSYTTEFRQLDTRLGRWFSSDPVFQPWQSSYTSMDNNPINLTDVLGLEANKKPNPGIPNNRRYRVDNKAKKPSEKSLEQKKAEVKNQKQEKRAQEKKQDEKKEEPAQEKKKPEQNKNEPSPNQQREKQEEVNKEKYEQSILPKLELKIDFASSGISASVVGYGWAFIRIDVPENSGWWESGNSLQNGKYGSLGGGFNSELKPKAGVEILGIGGGILKIDKDYFISHKTNSLSKLLNGAELIELSSSAGIKYTSLTFRNTDGQVIATANITSLSMSGVSPFSGSGDKGIELILKNKMNYKDSTRVAETNRGPAFDNYLKNKK